MVRPRVLMVTGAYVPELSGGGLQCRAIIDALRNDASFTVLTTSADPSLAERDEIDGVRVYRVAIDVGRAGSRLRAAVGIARRLWELRRDFDIVHLHGFSQKSMLIVPLAHALGKKVIVSLHTAGEDEPHAVKASGRMAYACYKAVDLFVAISPLVAESYRAAELPPEKLWIAQNGVDLQRFVPADPAAKEQLRRAIGLELNRRWILFVGFFSVDKGPKVLFDAWTRLPADERERSGLVFVGASRSRYHEVDPTIADAIRAEAVRYGGPERVVLRDETLRIEDYYRAADVFVFPSRREARGMTLVEAMACGLPVVASRLAGATDHVVDGITGYLVPPRDIDALAEALHRVLSDADRAAAVGRRARAAVAEQFDIRRTAPRMLDAYRHVLEPSGVEVPGLA